MKTHTKTILALLSLAVLTPSIVNADQRCRSTDVRFTNNTDNLIKIYKFEYYDIEDQKYRGETVSNLTLQSGATSGRTNETLEYVGNEAITSFKTRHKKCDTPDLNNPGNCLDWSSKRWSVASAATPAITNCIRDINIDIPVN